MALSLDSIFVNHINVFMACKLQCLFYCDELKIVSNSTEFYRFKLVTKVLCSSWLK